MDTLVEAKREYLFALCNVIIPHMNMAFYKIYVDGEQMCKGVQPLIQFQKLMREVPHWNQTLVKERTKEIVDDYPMFEKLLNITYVSFIKIMLSVRLTSDKRKLSIKRVDPEYFVHMCYKKAAIELYKKPEIFAKNVPEHEREIELTERFTVIIKKTMDEMIPMNNILLNLMADDEDTFNFHEEEAAAAEGETPDEVPAEDPIDALPEQAPEQPAPAEPYQPEVKSIPVTTGSSVPQPQQQSDSLFDDAAETAEDKNSVPQ
jgi:Family of unknown function (DUF5764)